MKISAIILAAGKGERAGFGKNKLLAPLYGAPALWHTLKKFAAANVSEVIVTASKSDFMEISALCAPFRFKTVLGGDTRTQSVKCALEAVTGDIVLIHDGARPFVTSETIEKCIECVKRYNSGVCGSPCSDTIAICDGEEINCYQPREKVFALQTPQGFFTCDIKKAYSLAGEKTYTDDSSVYREFIGAPHVFTGNANNVKLTYKQDFLREYPAITAYKGGRVGIGADVHAFGKGDYITLGGVKIKHSKSLIAHSDGDVVFHAVIDALFSAAGMRDIGCTFPDTDEKYRGADSGELLKTAVKQVKRAGYSVANVSVTVQAEQPKLKNYIEKMIENIARCCSVSVPNVAVAAGTCEGLGFVGEGLGIAAYACVNLTKDKAAALV